MQIQNANPPIQVTGRHVSVTEAMKEYCRRKVASLHLDYPKIIEAQVILDVQKYRHVAEIVLHCGNRITIEASSTSSDMYASVDGVVDRVARQMRKHKTRFLQTHRPRKNGLRSAEKVTARWQWIEPEQPAQEEGRVNEEAAAVPEDGTTEATRVVHTEKYPVKPMYLDEAVLQMERSARQFLVFLNAKSDRVNVLYRRKSGDFGVIEPTFAK